MISPSSAYADRGPRRELYQRHVPEYWIVDPDAKLIERWRPGDARPEILRSTADWRPFGLAIGVDLDLQDFFVRTQASSI